MTDRTSTGRVRLRRDGPLVVEGDVPVRQAQGRPIEPTGRGGGDRGRVDVALCRCGQSGSRPRCDGTHRSHDPAPGPVDAPAAPASSADGPCGVEVHAHGPLVVRGWPIHLPDGAVVDLPVVTVCGCGRTAAPPWCDGAGCAGPVTTTG